MNRGSERVMGFSCNAALVTSKEKKGNHKAFLVVWTAIKVYSCNLILSRGKRSREEEENILTQLILNMIARCSNIHESLLLPISLIHSEDSLSENSIDFLNYYDQLNQEKIPYFRIQKTADILTGNSHNSKGLILSGSFNPLHEGHLQLIEAAFNFLQKRNVNSSFSNQLV